MCEDERLFEEDVVAEVEWSNAEELESKSCSLIGRLMSSKAVNRNMMKNMLLKGWNVKDLKVSELENNIFFFAFSCEKDRSRILRNRPWTVTGILLLVQEWNVLLPICDVQWKFCPYWIQFHGLPLGGLSSKNAGILGGKIGDVLEVENPFVDGKLRRDFLRARVLVDIMKPLLCGLWIPRPSMEKVWISCKYEKLQIFCYKCGCVDHDFRVCKKRRAMLNDESGSPRYGSWLGVPPLRSRVEMVQNEDANWRWRSAEDLRNEEKKGDEQCNNSVKVEILLNSVKARGNSSSSKHDDCFSNDDSNAIGVSGSGIDNMTVDCDPVLENKSDCDTHMPSIPDSYLSSGQLKSDSKTVNLPLDERKCDKQVFWSEDGYFVEFPLDCDDSSVVSRTDKNFILLIDGMGKISLKRKWENEDDVLSVKRRKRKSVMEVDSDFSYGSVISVGTGKRKGRRDKEKVLEALKKWNDKVLFDVPVSVETDSCGVSFSGASLSDADVKVCGWPKAATEGL